MKITGTLTDEATLAELARRVKRARLDRQMSQADLANAAGLARPTIERFEAAGVAQLGTLVRILRALDLVDRLEVLLPDANVRPIEALESLGQGRKRASRTRHSVSPSKPWTWGDEQ